jgi:fructose-bisphosphate aldolase class I
MQMTSLHETALSLVAAGKGILAADESTGTITKRLDAVGVESTEENRQKYRDLLFTTPGIEDFLAGIILFDETIRQSSADGTPFPELLEKLGIIPGIKVDKGVKPLALSEGETVTEGLDGLRERFEEYRDLGARFAKWRATYVVDAGSGLPSDYAVSVNAHALARYAALSQEAGLVPIVEPEVLMTGTHTIEQSFAATRRVLRGVYAELRAQRVELEGTLLKPNMVLPGYDCAEQVSDGEIAEATVRCLRESVPPAVPGIVFLSGGQSPEAATRRLNAMNQQDSQAWQLAFSFSRALQEPVLEAWRGRSDHVTEAQKIFFQRARCNSAARKGAYDPAMEIDSEAA